MVTTDIIFQKKWPWTKTHGDGDINIYIYTYIYKYIYIHICVCVCMHTCSHICEKTYARKRERNRERYTKVSAKAMYTVLYIAQQLSVNQRNSLVIGCINRCHAQTIQICVESFIRTVYSCFHTPLFPCKSRFNIEWHAIENEVTSNQHINNCILTKAHGWHCISYMNINLQTVRSQSTAVVVKTECICTGVTRLSWD